MTRSKSCGLVLLVFRHCYASIQRNICLFVCQSCCFCLCALLDLKSIIAHFVQSSQLHLIESETENIIWKCTSKLKCFKLNILVWTWFIFIASTSEKNYKYNFSIHVNNTLSPTLHDKGRVSGSGDTPGFWNSLD